MEYHHPIKGRSGEDFAQKIRRVTSVRSGQAHRWRLLVMMLLGFVDGLSQL